MGRELGLFLEHRRTELGLSRRDLAERSGLSYPYVSQLETGLREPAVKAMRQLATALDVGVEDLAARVSGSDWATSSAPRAYVMAEAVTSAPSSRVDEKVLYAVERRLRELPPVERLALLTRLLAQTVDELDADQAT